MPTMKRRDFDTEIAAWLEDVHASQAGTELYAELWVANGQAKEITDKASPAAEEAHERINGLIARIEAL